MKKRFIAIGSGLASIGVILSCGIGFLSSCGKSVVEAPAFENAEATTEAIGVFENADSLLRKEKEYFILGKGNVDAKKSGVNLTSQKIYSVTARNNDQYLIESNSYSGMVKCATRAYSQEDSSVKVFFGSDVSKDGSKAKWNEEKYTSYTKEEYKQSWGRYIEDAFVYKIDENTVLSQEYLGTQEGYSQYRLFLDPETACQDYKNQMKTISNLPEHPKFKEVQFIFTVDSSGYMVSSTTYEVYTTKYSGFTADCVGSITSYYYYGDVKIPSLLEDSHYDGEGKKDFIPGSNVEISKEEIQPISKIIQGFTNEPYSGFTCKLTLRNPNQKEICKLNLNLYLDLSNLDCVKIQGSLASQDYGYNFNINFSFDLGEKILYIYSNKINFKYDVNNLNDTINYVINFINQFLENKIDLDLSMPEIDLDSLISSLSSSTTESLLSNGNFKWNISLDVLGGIDCEIYGAKDTYQISKILIQDIALKDYHIGLECNVEAFEESPIVPIDADLQETADLSDSIKILDFFQNLIDSKRFALNAVASKVNELGEETYSLTVDGQFDIGNSNYYADFGFEDINGVHSIKVGYDNENAYISYQDKMNGYVSKASLEELFTYVRSLLNDEEFMNRISNSFIPSNDSLNLIEAIKNGELDQLSSNAIDIKYDNSGINILVDLSIVGLEGYCELLLPSDGSGIDALNVSIQDNNEVLSISFTFAEIKDIPEVDLSSFIDFSSLPRLIKILKGTIFDNSYLIIKGNLKVKIPVIVNFEVGVSAYFNINDFSSLQAIVSLDIPINILLNNDKDDFGYPSVQDGSLSSIESRNTTLYVYDNYIIFQRTDVLKYKYGFLGLGGSEKFTYITYRKYTFSELGQNYMDAIYYALGATNSAKGIIDSAIANSKNKENSEKNDYSQIVTDYSYNENALGGGTYSITTDLGAMLHSDSLSTLQIGLVDDGEILRQISVNTSLAGVVTISGTLNLEVTNNCTQFNGFDSFVNEYTGESKFL